MPPVTRTTMAGPAVDRSAAIRPESYDPETREFDLVLTSGARWTRHPAFDEPFEEELEVTRAAIEGDRLDSGRFPIMADHSDGVDRQIGVGLPNSSRIEDGSLIMRGRLSAAPEFARYRQDVADGILSNLSLRYIPNTVRDVTPRNRARRRLRVVSWTPLHVAFVSAGADPGACVRSATGGESTYPFDLESDMPPEDTTANEPQRTQTAPASDGAQDRTATGGESTQPTTTTTTPANSAEAPAAPAPASSATETATTSDRSAAGAPVNAPRSGDDGGVERERCLGIISAVRNAGLPATFADELISSSVSLSDARGRVLDRLASSQDRTEPETSGSGVEVTREGESGVVAAIGEYLDRRAGVPVEGDMSEGCRDLMRRPVMDVAERLVSDVHKVNTRGMSRDQLLEAAFMQRGGNAGAHGRTDFTHLAANTMNRSLRRAYEAAPRTFTGVSEQVFDLTDFRQRTRVQMSELTLEEVPEHAEVKLARLQDTGESYGLIEYAKRVAFTRKMMIDDDLSALGRIPRAFAIAGAQIESDVAWLLWYSAANPNGVVMSDGNALFSAAHGNLAGSGAALDKTTLSAARVAMRLQTGLSGQRLNVSPRRLVVSPADETAANELLTQITPRTSADVNPFADTLDPMPVVEPRLTVAAGSQPWWVAADPASMPIMEWGYLSGSTGPMIETMAGWTVLGQEFRAVHDFAAGIVEHRGVYKNPGA